MTDEFALLNRLYQKSRRALSQRLAYKNEKFLSVVKEAVHNPDCLVCGHMIHVSFEEISAADDIPLPFQVAMHSKRGLGVLRWDTFEDAVAARGESDADKDHMVRKLASRFLNWQEFLSAATAEYAKKQLFK